MLTDTCRLMNFWRSYLVTRADKRYLGGCRLQWVVLKECILPRSSRAWIPGCPSDPWSIWIGKCLEVPWTYVRLWMVLEGSSVQPGRSSCFHHEQMACGFHTPQKQQLELVWLSAPMVSACFSLCLLPRAEVEAQELPVCILLKRWSCSQSSTLNHMLSCKGEE